MADPGSNGDARPAAEEEPHEGGGGIGGALLGPVRAVGKQAGRLVSRRSLADAVAGRTVMVTGSSSGIGRETAKIVAASGGIPLLVARRASELESAREEIEELGGTAHAYPADLTDSDTIAALAERALADHGAVDYLVNNAGHSIRRSIVRSLDRPHDFERTMELNYFASIRLTMALIPHWRERRRGHVVNVSTMGVQTRTPRFSAYLASKAALDMWTAVAAGELARYRISFTLIHMPLVRTPMIAPTELYDAFPALSPTDAARMICKGLRDRPAEVGQPIGRALDVAGTLTPGMSRDAWSRIYEATPETGGITRDAEGNRRELNAAQRAAIGVLRRLRR